MELTKLIVTVAIVIVVMTDVVVCRPHSRSTDLQALVQDIDDRLIRGEQKRSRRRRRHLQTQQLALMDYCLRFPHRCRQEMERIRRLRNEQREFRVVIIEK